MLGREGGGDGGLEGVVLGWVVWWGCERVREVLW